MKIQAFSKPGFTGLVGEYEVLVNPENYKIRQEQEYSTTTTTNASSIPAVKYKGGGQSFFEVVLFFDGTGVVTRDKVDEQIRKVKDLVYKYNGTIHEPNYIRIFWGSQFLFEGRLKSWDVSYTMLDMDGTPLRAEANALFVASASEKKRALEENRNSADLTHVRMVLAGDNLPIMCYRIYGDSSYYLQVAQHNGITNFREIEPGMEIEFPPVI